MRLALDQIRLDGGTQSRAAIDEGVAAEYAETYRYGGPDALPAVTVFFDGVSYVLADGFHRVLGASRAELNDIDVDVRHGTLRDAILWSVGANAEHGLRRTAADKRKAVHTLLADPEWASWADRAIARACGVSHTFVQNERGLTGNVASGAPGQPAGDRGLTCNVASETTSERTYITKHGTEATMNVAEIRKGKKAKPEPEPQGAETPPAEASVEVRPDVAELLDDLQRDLAESEAKVKSLSNSDTGAEILRLHQMLDHANRKADEAQGKLAKTAEREAWNMKQLRRCGRAVGEDEPSRIASKVEALARAIATE